MVASKFFEIWKKKIFSFTISSKLHSFFYKLGYNIATYPIMTIALAWLIMVTTCFGFINFEYLDQNLHLSVNEHSKLARDTDWYLNTSSRIVRDEEVLIVAPNVLDPKVLQRIALLTNEIMNLTVDYENFKDIKWQDFCLEIPNIYSYTAGDSSEDFDDYNVTSASHPFEPVVDLELELFCSVFNSLDSVCYQQNLLALWSYDADIVQNLTLAEVIDTLNKTTIDPTTGHSVDVLRTLGGIELDESGQVISAKAMLLNFPVENTIQDIINKNGYATFKKKEWVTGQTHTWETAFNNRIKQLKIELEKDINMTIYYFSASTYTNNNNALIARAIKVVIIGSIAMFIFLLSVLSDFSWISVRLFVGFAGICCISMGLISGFGVCCSFTTITYSQITIPFIILGLGVDDIFVIVATLKKVKVQNKTATPEHIFGLTLQKAGTSITITTLTNVIVFLVGVGTSTAFVADYCIIAGTSIFTTYCYVITFFMAILALDERRIAARRNALMPCIRHEIKTMKMDEKDVEFIGWVTKMLEWIYSHILLTKIGRIFCIVPAFILLVNGLPYITDVKQTFDIRSYFIRSTPPYQFLTKKWEHYPQVGHQAFVFLGSLNYTAEWSKIAALSYNLSLQSDITYDLNSWVEPFEQFLTIYYSRNMTEQPLTDQEFKVYLNEFLHSSMGLKFTPYFIFKTPLSCEGPPSDIKMSMLPFRYKAFNESHKTTPAMDRIADVIHTANLTSGYATDWSKVYYHWNLDRLALPDTIRNLSVGCIAVTLCTAILVVDFQMCLWIQLCVLFTMLDVVGFMSRFDLAFDHMTSLGLQLAIGLSVDYAVHIGHTFLINQGARQQRVVRAVVDIAPPVFHGGVSTILMFGMLATMDAYATQLFIKIFVMVVIFGLYHGLVFLPAILSLVGPKSYTEDGIGSINPSHIDTFNPTVQLTKFTQSKKA